jgi:WD40 repeat protein/DNA-directed RNA polymerase specialized sigma24 family protein
VKLGEHWGTIAGMHETGEIMKSNFQRKDPMRADDPEAIELAYLLQNSTPNDPDVLERLVNRYAVELYKWVEILVYYRKSALPSKVEIFDILKIVFWTAIKRVDQFHGKEKVSDWLFAISYQVTKGWKFNAAAVSYFPWEKQGEELEAKFQEPLPTDQYLLHRLPEKVRSILILRYLFALDLPDIGLIINAQVNDVHHQLIKGRKRLIADPSRLHRKIKIQPFVDGLLMDDPDELDKLNRHLAECETCSRALEQIETFEKNLVEDLNQVWILPVLNSEWFNAMIQSVKDEMTKPENGRMLKFPLRQTAWIVGLILLIAGFALISIRLIPVDKQFAEPAITPVQPLPPVVEMRQTAGLSQNRIDVPNAPQYIAPAFSSDGKWAVFAATNFSVSSPSLIFQTIEVYNQEANTLQLISESSAFVNSWVWWDLAPSISADGRWIVYVSTSKEPHLSGNACSTPDYRNCLDIFLYDRLSRAEKRITQAVNGGSADGDSLAPTISADGQWVVFWSTANNLVEGYNSNCQKNGTTIACLSIYLYNVATGKISRIPVRTIPGENVYGVDRISLSADARYIGFTVSSSAQAGIPSLESPSYPYIRGEAPRYTVAESNIPVILHSSEAIIYDRETLKYELENQTQDGVPGDGPSSSPVISADGRYVAFVSASTNLVSRDHNTYSDVFVRDRETGKIELVSQSSTGKSGNGDSGYIFTSRGYYSLNISEDGRYVVFESSAGNLNNNSNRDCSLSDNRDCHYLYVHDRQTGITNLITAQTNQDFTLFPNILSDGQLISYMQYVHNCSSIQSQCSNVMLYNPTSNWISNLTKYDAQTPTLPWSYSGSISLPWQSWESTAFALSPDSSQIALGGYDSKVRIWKSSAVNNSTPKGFPVKILEIAGNESFSSLAFSPNGELLAGGTTNGSVYVWQLSDGTLQYSMQDQPDLVRRLVFTQDGSELVVSTLHEAWTWQLGDSQMNSVNGFSSTLSEALNIDISPKGNMIASAREDGTVWLQSLLDGNVIARLGTNQLSARSLAFSNDGGMLATQSSDGMIALWDITASEDQISSITLVNNYRSLGYTGELAFSPDNKYLASSRTAGEITLWSIPDGTVFSLVTPATDGMLYNIAFGDSGNKLAAVFENEIVLWGIPNNNSSTYFIHATSDNYVDLKPSPEATANDVPGLQSPKGSVLIGGLSLDQVTQAIPFPMLVPIHLPDNIRFQNASVNKDGSIMLLYEVSTQEGDQESLYIYEQSVKNSTPPTMTIGANASVLLTHVRTNSGNALGEFVQGDWMWRQSYTPATGESPMGVIHDVWDWESNSSTGRLRWQQNDILIDLYYQVYRSYSPTIYLSPEMDHLLHLSTILDQADLVQIASGMVPYVAMNTAKTSYNPVEKGKYPMNNINAIGLYHLYPAVTSVRSTFSSQEVLRSK